MKIKIDVPKGIRYLSEWHEFRLSNFKGHSILHKQLPGCGFTKFALTCPEPVVLCSPRIMLMENKKDQHGDDVYLVVNNYEVATDIDEDISKSILSGAIKAKDDYLIEMAKEENKNRENLYSRLFQEIYDYLGRIRLENRSPKIIVTYDSAHLVKEILTSMGLIDYFYFCIDEFQSTLDDARFKSDIELELLTVLRDIKNVLYTSATPMLDKYLQQIPELSSLPYYELDWGSLDSARIKKPNLKVRTMSSLSGKMAEIIQSYLNGNYEKVLVNRGGQLLEVESREAVFYVNSVNHIIGIIKKMGLTPDQCNILCSDTPFNQSRIDKKLGKKKGFSIGKVPLLGQPHKMFTFCTRTVYLGADFYSDNARSFIFSDSNSDCLSIDISMDLYQILGRERLNINPWKNSAEFYYRSTCDYKKMTQEDLNNRIRDKIKKTNTLLQGWKEASNDEIKKALAENYQKVTKLDKYKDDYVAVNRRDNLTPVFNNLVLINEQRAFDIQQIDYADRFSVFSSLEREFIDGYSKEEDYVREFFSYYDQLLNYIDKIKCICDYLIQFPSHSGSIIGNLADSDKIKQQLITLGPLKIKGLGYHITKINQAMGITIFDQNSLDNAVYSSFKENEKYTKKFIKSELGVIYKSADYQGTPKATDLSNWFELKVVQITINGRREEGFKLIKRKL